MKNLGKGFEATSTTGEVKPLLALLLFLTAATANAAEKRPWDGRAFSGDPSQVARAAASLPAPEGADAVVLLDELRYTFQSDGRATRALRVVYRILTQNGVENRDFVSCRWEPWHEERPRMRARVVTVDGAAHELDPKTIAETPIRSGEKVISDARVLQAPLPGLGPGAVVSELGPAQIVENTETWGNLETNYRAYYSDAEQKTLRERLEAYVKEQYTAEALTAMEKSAPADLSHHFQLRLEAAKAKVANTQPDGATVLIQAGGLFAWVPDALKGDMADADTSAEKEKKRRKSDLVLPQPHVVEWRYHIVPPVGFKASELPESARHQLGPALVTEEYSQGPDGSVTGVLRFDTVKRRYTAPEVGAFRAGLKEYLSSPATLVHFEQIGFALLRAGRVKEALETFRALAASHPKGEALHHVQMARALVEAGLGEAAREEARHAVALEPNSAEAYKTLAWVLSRDLLGREFEKGYDRDGAEAAYRKAKELDPDDKATVGNLAILLEHDPDGARYGTEAKMDAAIKEYESIKDKLHEPQIPDNLIIAMLHAGRFKDLKEQLKTLPPSELHRTLLVAAIAAADGSKPAVMEARRLAGSGSERSTLLASAGRQLLVLRHYSEAADVLVASSEGSPQAAQIAQQAEIFRSIRKHEELKLKMDRAEDVVLYFWTAMFVGTPEQVLKIESPLAREKDEAKELKKGKATFAFVRASMRNLDVPRDVVADLALAQIQPKVDGEDAYGYRVRADMPGTGKGVFYLTKENRQVRLLAMTPPTANETGNLGRLVLRISAKDPESARRWLDWAREEATMGGGDDPLAGGAFPRFWTRGQTAADAATLRYAAAALATEADNPEEAGPILLEGRAAAKDETERQKFDLALAQFYAKQEKYAELLPVAQRLTAAAPASRTAFGFLYIALSGMERYAEVESAAAERLLRFPDEVSTLRADSMAAAKRGDFAKSDRILKAMIDSGKAEARDLNNLAWNQLFEGGAAAEEAAQTAQRGMRLSQTPNANLLHTLACAYAEAGKTREAHDALLQTMAAMGLEEPNGLIWYIVGRMAEQYGLSPAAANAYRKVEKPESRLELPLSTFTLAQRRLKGVGVTSAAPASAGPVSVRASFPTLPTASLSGHRQIVMNGILACAARNRTRPAFAAGSYSLLPCGGNGSCRAFVENNRGSELFEDFFNLRVLGMLRVF